MRRIVAAVLGAAVVVAVGPSPAQAKPAFQVTIGFDRPTGAFQGALRVSGKVTPTPPSGVRIYVRYAGKSTYTYEAATTVKSDGSYSKIIHLDGGSGTATVKVVRDSTSTRAAGSAAKNIKVYGYLPLYKLPRTTLDGAVGVGLWTNNGFKEYGSMRFKPASDGNTSAARFDLSNQCTEFTEDNGMDDGAGTGAVGQVLMYGTSTGGATMTQVNHYEGGKGDSFAGGMSLEQTTVSGTVLRARYLMIQMSLTTEAIWGVDGYALCNLPGAVSEDSI